VPLLLFPLVVRPVYGIAVTVAVIAVALAWRSVAWPIVLAGAPAILIGLLGRNPFPNGSIAVALFAWTLLAIAIATASGNEALTFRSLLNVPVVATIVLAVLLIVRLGGSSAYAYGSVKVQLFIAENLFGVVAGMAIARRARHFRVLTAGLVAVAAVTAVVLAHGISSGGLEATVGGRFSVDQEASPIGLGRAAAQGILVAVFLILTAAPPLVRLLAVGAMPLIAVSFIASGSRGPVLGLIVGLIVLLALILRDRRARLRVGLAAVGGVAGALLVTQLVPGQDIQRSLSILTGSGNGLSSNGRDALWQQAWDIFRQHPLFGIGTGGFAGVAPADLYPHNLFLELGAEVGIFGVVATVLVLIGGVLALRRADRVSGGLLGAEVALVAALLAAAFVNAQVSSAVTENAAIWLAVGLALGLAQRATAMAAPSEPAPRPLLRRRERTPSGLGAPRRPQGERGWESPAVVRSSGEIVLPSEGAVVGGVVTVAGRPARTGWGVRSVQLELSRDGGSWQEAAAVAVADAAVVVRVVEGFRGEVALVRSDHIARLLAAELSELDGGEYVVDHAARRPWAATSWSADWDTTALPDGEYALRVVTLDMAGIRTASPVRSVTVSASADRLERRRGVDALWETLRARESELAALEQALTARSAEIARLSAAQKQRSAALAARETELEQQQHALAARAEDLDRDRAALVRWQGELESRHAKSQAARRVAAKAAAPSSPATAARKRGPDPARRPRAAAVPPGRITLQALESRVAAKPHPDAIVQHERETALEALRPFAEPDGGIPVQFEQMVQEMFGDLLGDV
jgi:O-antigen ligase